MIRPGDHSARLRRDAEGAALVEFAIVLSLFVFILFGFIDFARQGFSYVMASKATERAVRIASVSPPVCGTLPVQNVRGPASSAPYGFGASCSLATGLCLEPKKSVCVGSTSSPTAVAIWNEIEDLMPSNATIANLRFGYGFDPALNFLGGPYTPVVTVEIRSLQFEYISPLGSLVALVGGGAQSAAGPGFGSDFLFPTMSASLPAEDLS